MSKVWLSNIDPLEYFTGVKSKGAFLLLGQQQKSLIGLNPLRIFTDLDSVEAFLQEYPRATVMGFKSYPDTHSEYTCKLPNEMWFAFGRVIEIRPTSQEYEYRETLLNLPHAEYSEVVATESSVQFCQEQDFEVSLSKVKYIETVEAIREDIAAGKYYQANLTFAIRKQSEKNPFEIFTSYYRKNPANYFCYFEYNDIAIISASPELFLQKQNSHLMAMPIKGTISKKYPAIELLKSEKDRAELNMITDLFRNDLYRVCKAESVTVSEQHAVLELEQLYHLYSKVEGELEPAISLKDVFTATFPSGSITGCPKIRSQQAIAQYESHARGIYTGSIGWIQKDSFCMNIAIRTMLAKEQSFYYHVGGGIVYDSQPESEWQECLLKAKTFLDLL